MAAITTDMIKELRGATGAGILECRKALQQADGDMKAALDFLREKGLATAQKRASRNASEGVVETYYCDECKLGVLFELNTETDFVGRSEPFLALGKALLDQIVETNPADVAAMLAAPYIKDNSITVQDLLNQNIASMGENVVPRRFAYYKAEPNTLVEVYNHQNTGRVGVMVELAADEIKDEAALRKLAHQIALQIAFSNPPYISEEDIPEEVIAHEKGIAENKAREEGKKEAIIPRIVEGTLKKYKDEFVLLNQPYILDESITVRQYIENEGKAMGSSVSIKRFARYALGDTASSEE